MATIYDDIFIDARKDIISIIMAMIAMFIICGCSDKNLTNCRVVEKEHHPMWVQTVPIRIGNVTTYSTIVHPEKWVITVVGTDEDGEYDHKDIYVDEDTWKKLEINDQVEDR